MKPKANQGALAIAVPRSSNEKIGDCATTYAAQASCPRSCVFFNGGGCYAENGRIFTSTTGPLNETAERLKATPVDVARTEATAIGLLPVFACMDRPLRLHTVGDCRTDEAARIVADAAAEYRRRGGGPVWTYTHAWRIVDRESWGDVSVLASCETPEQIELARGRGYATAIVVEEFASRRRHFAGGAAILPCPAQTTDRVTCSSCRLCMDDAGLRERGYSIGFAVHGTALSVKKATESLRHPSDAARRLTTRDHIAAFEELHGRLPSVKELQLAAGVVRASAVEMLERIATERGAA